MATRKEVETWLSSPDCEPTDLESISGETRKQLESFLLTPGLGALVGLMLGARQTKFIQLSNLRLSSPERVATASVIQGEIAGIDLLRQTLLELMQPAEAASEEQGQ